jgi:hypothetical protein
LKVIKAVGVVFGVAVLTSATLFLLGVATSLIGNMGWIHLGEYQPWLPLAGLVYGFPLGILIGVIVAVKKAEYPTAGIVELIIKPLLRRVPRVQIYADYACAWIILALGVLGILRIEVVHPAHAVLDTPLLWIFVAMFNFLRLRNEDVVRLRVFCIGANLSESIFEVARMKMWGVYPFLVVAVPIFCEAIFSIVRSRRPRMATFV